MNQATTNGSKKSITTNWSLLLMGGFFLLAMFVYIDLRGRFDAQQIEINGLKANAAQPMGYVLPTIFVGQVQQICHGGNVTQTVNACDFSHFAQQRGAGSVQYSFADGECPTFNIPPGMVAVGPVDPRLFVGMVQRIYEGPVSLTACDAVFSTTVGFMVTAYK